MFDNMFEIELNQDYEDNYEFNKLEMTVKHKQEEEAYEKEEKERRQYRKINTKERNHSLQKSI